MYIGGSTYPSAGTHSHGCDGVAAIWRWEVVVVVISFFIWF